MNVVICTTPKHTKGQALRPGGRLVQHKGGEGSGFTAEAGHCGIQGQQGGSRRCYGASDDKQLRMKLHLNPEQEKLAQTVLRKFSHGRTSSLRDLYDIYTFDDTANSGLRAELTFISDRFTSKSHPNTMRIGLAGRVYDKTGTEVGDFARALMYDPISDVAWVDNMVFDLRKTEAQNQGFGYNFYRHCEERLKALGARYITLFADIDVGKYAWARMGFDAVDESQRMLIKQRHQDIWREVYGPDVPAPEFEHMWDLAAMQGPHTLDYKGQQVHYGKWFLLSLPAEGDGVGDAGWEGIKYLDDGQESWNVGQLYYQSKPQRGKKGGEGSGFSDDHCGIPGKQGGSQHCDEVAALPKTKFKVKRDGWYISDHDPRFSYENTVRHVAKLEANGWDAEEEYKHAWTRGMYPQVVELGYKPDWGMEPGEWTAYRAGKHDNQPTTDGPVSIFFSPDVDGAEAYMDETQGETLRQYRLKIENPLYAKNQTELARRYFKRDYHRWIETAERKDPRAVHTIDNMLAEKARKEGYDAIVYTDPFAPATRELCVLYRHCIVELLAEKGVPMQPKKPRKIMRVTTTTAKPVVAPKSVYGTPQELFKLVSSGKAATTD